MRYNIALPLIAILMNTACASAQRPVIEIDSVPRYGSDGLLRGHVQNADPATHKVASYIYVGAWWSKPTLSEPTVAVQPDGSFSAAISLEPTDVNATRVAAFLLPSTAVTPTAAGTPQLPAELDELAIASVIHDRNVYDIVFANRVWEIKRATNRRVGPGPNYFSPLERDVWVEDNGHLHLTISNQDGRWWCTEVVLQENLGYGTYAFYTRGRVDIHDPNIILGLFTWDTHGDAGGPWPYREIDFEFTRWSDPDNPTNAQFVVQPWDQPGTLRRYRVDLTDEQQDLTCVWIWSPGRVDFATYYGHHPLDNLPQDQLEIAWTYDGQWVPDPGRENVRFNYWLNNGNAPMNGQPSEVTITDFVYLPLDAADYGAGWMLQ